jgi:hypothetical protein
MGSGARHLRGFDSAGSGAHRHAAIPERRSLGLQRQAWPRVVVFADVDPEEDPAGTAYDQGQEFLRAAVDDDLGRVHVRWYKNDGIYNEAYDGIAVVDYQEQGGAAGDLDTVAVQLLGQGPRNTIPHPALS